MSEQSPVRFDVPAFLRGEDPSAALLEHAATTHGEDSMEPDHEVGDLQVYLRKALALMTVAQRAAFYADAEVRATLAVGLGDDTLRVE